MNDNFVNVDNVDDSGSLSLNEDHFESNEYDDESSSDDEVFIQTKVEDNICKSQLPLQLELSSQKFELVCATTHSSNHFKAIFFLFNSFYLIDDLKPSENIQKIPRSKVISCVYYSK